MGLLKGLKISTFLDTYQEWHALVEGFCETFCTWRANYKPSPELIEDLRSEHHYYAFGRVLGLIARVLFGWLVTRILRGKPKKREYKRP